MELKSRKYRNRLIVIIVLLIISIILGVIAEKINKKNAEYVDNLAETIQSIPAEEYDQKIKEKGIESELSGYETKEKALEIVQSWQNLYQPIFGHTELFAIIIHSFAMLGSMMGVMMYVIFTSWILNKIWPDMKKWMLILMPILVLILLIKLLFYIIIIVGIIGQIPFIIYTIIKFFKTKKEENKDDIIKEEKS